MTVNYIGQLLILVSAITRCDLISAFALLVDIPVVIAIHSLLMKIKRTTRQNKSPLKTYMIEET